MNPLLLFVHIPKTAGMTMRDILEREYGSEQCYLFNDEDQRANPLTPEQIRHNITGKQLVYGHMAYGFHRYLEQSYQYMTVLRNPLAQVISLINHYRRQKKMTHWDGLVAFTQNRPQTYRNWQLKMLTHADTLYTEYELTHDDLEVAKQRLRDDFPLLGLAEHFDESLLYFQHCLGWKTPYYLKLNVSQRYLQQDIVQYEDLTPTEQDLLRDWNAYDLDLYAYACALFKERLATVAEISSWRLQRYRLQNRLYYWETVGRRRLGLAH